MYNNCLKLQAQTISLFLNWIFRFLTLFISKWPINAKIFSCRLNGRPTLNSVCVSIIGRTFKNYFNNFPIVSFRFFFTYFQSGRWLYGLFYVLNWNERIIFMAFNYFVSVLVMKLGIMLQNMKRDSKTSKRNFKLE